MTSQNHDSEQWSPQGPVTELSEQNCWILLGDLNMGRLGVSVNDQPNIFPVNYFVDGRSIIFRTADGTKKSELLTNSSVVFEADERTDDGAWSVTVKGSAAVVEDERGIPRAAHEALPEWIPTKEFVYVRITPAEVHGRRFERRVRPGLFRSGDASFQEQSVTNWFG
ncbi:MAG: pyridoxamine 5'-phosphate oxidase family protein [Microbacteriaceae bacterium]